MFKQQPIIKPLENFNQNNPKQTTEFKHSKNYTIRSHHTLKQCANQPVSL